jgi:Flavodoxin
VRIAVIYESIYGNTGAIAEAIADGLRVHGDVTLEPADDQAFMDVDLLVVGAPTHAHGLPTAMTRRGVEAAAQAAEEKGQPLESGPTPAVRSFVDRLQKGTGRSAACFDTRFDKSPLLTGSAAKTIAKKLGRLGYELVAPPESFFVLDSEGPLMDGELERAREWGASLIGTP